MTKELLGILFQVDSDNSSPTKSISLRIRFDLIGSCSLRCPHPLSVVIVGFGNDNNFRTSQESRIKANTKLSNKIDISSFKSLKEVSGSRLGNST